MGKQDSHRGGAVLRGVVEDRLNSVSIKESARRLGISERRVQKYRYSAEGRALRDELLCERDRLTRVQLAEEVASVARGRVRARELWFETVNRVRAAVDAGECDMGLLVKVMTSGPFMAVGEMLSEESVVKVVDAGERYHAGVKDNAVLAGALSRGRVDVVEE